MVEPDSFARGATCSCRCWSLSWKCHLWLTVASVAGPYQHLAGSVPQGGPSCLPMLVQEGMGQQTRMHSSTSMHSHGPPSTPQPGQPGPTSDPRNVPPPRQRTILSRHSRPCYCTFDTVPCLSHAPGLDLLQGHTGAPSHNQALHHTTRVIRGQACAHVL